MKKLLIFDAYGTLISTGTGSLDAVTKILSLHDKAIDAHQFYAEWKRIHRLHLDQSYAGNFVTEREIFSQDLKQLYRIYDIDRPYSDDVQIMLDSLYGRKLFPDTFSAITALRKNFRVVIGSTTDTEPLLANLQTNGLETDAVYTSEMLRCYKPDKRFYQSILRAEDISADDAVFIGDSPVDDIAGPQSVGITTILVDRNSKHSFDASQIVPNYVVESLSEIVPLIS